MTKKLPQKSPAKTTASGSSEKPARPSITIMIEDFLKFSGDYKFVESILNHFPEPITVKNSKGEFLVYNKAIEKVGGYSRDEAVGKSISITGQKKFVEDINKADEEVLNSGKSLAIETDFKNADGELIHMTIAKHRIKLPNNEHGILTIGNDITRSRSTENLLEIQYTIDFLASLTKGLYSTLTIILEHIFKLFWVDAGGIYLFDKNEKILNLVIYKGLSKKYVQHVKSYTQNSPEVKILLSNTNIYIPVSKLNNDTSILAKKEGILSVSINPLIDPGTGDLIGALNLGSKKLNEISEFDKKGIESIARRIVNLILYAQSQEKLKEYQSSLEQKIEEKTADLAAKMELLTLRDKKIKQSEQELKKLHDHLPVGIFSTNMNGEIKYGNKKFCEIFGCKSIKELRQTPMDNYFVAGHSRDEINHAIMEKGKLNGIEVELRRLDHTPFCGLLRANIVHDANGNPYQIEGILEDITESKNTRRELELSHEKLKRNEEKYRKLQENLPIGIFTTNFEGKFLHVNPSSVKIFGYKSADELMKVPVPDVYYSKEQRSEFLQTLLADGKLIKKEVQLVKKDKTVFWGLISAQAVFNKEGKPFLFDGIVEDISEIKSTRLKLEESNKKITLINQNLEEKIREALASQEEQNSLLIQKSKLESLGELAAGIAHEINQPLGVMALTFENLKLKIKAPNFDQEYLEAKFKSIDENINRIRDIIDHVRLFSREQDTFVLDKINVNKIIQKALSLIGVQMGNHNININLKLEEKIGYTVGSNLKLEQVILNLLSNSKYALEEKAISVGDPDFSKEVVIKTETTSNRIYIMIEDNGIGIKLKHLPYIFDPFFTTKPEGFGTGLGLSIVYGLVKDMRGEILVNSREREYTKFRISFPRFPEND